MLILDSSTSFSLVMSYASMIGAKIFIKNTAVNKEAEESMHIR
jgi:hypothetical protein